MIFDKCNLPGGEGFDSCFFLHRRAGRKKWGENKW